MADLSPLSGLKQLVSLNISDGYMGLSGYQTLDPLKALTNLKSLSLRNYNIQDLTGLENLRALENLYIETGDQLTDISALRDLEDLTNVTLQLDGHENHIADMSPPGPRAQRHHLLTVTAASAARPGLKTPRPAAIMGGQRTIWPPAGRVPGVTRR